MSEPTKVGELIDPTQPRDAIHIAVAPVTATETLSPGQYIGFTGEDSVHVSSCEPAMSIGIVDPFLRTKVKEGQACWMFMHPNTITSLRHQWDHPAFRNGADDMRELSRKALKECADEMEITLEEAIQAGHDWVKHGSRFTQYGSTYAQDWMDNDKNREKFWRSFEGATGLKVPDHEDQPFSCSC